MGHQCHYSPSENTETEERAAAQSFFLLQCHLHMCHHNTILTILACNGNSDHMCDAYDNLALLEPTAKNRKLLEYYAAVLTIE